jgi:hypothetical protein
MVITDPQYGYFSRFKAIVDGCYVYQNHQNELCFVTLVSDVPLDSDAMHMAGQFVGRLTRFYRTWECGGVATNKIGKTHAIFQVPDNYLDAESFLSEPMHSQQMDTEDASDGCVSGDDGLPQRVGQKSILVEESLFKIPQPKLKSRQKGKQRL